MPEDKVNIEKEVSTTNGKNLHDVKCKFCSSIILTPDSATHTINQYDLPLMEQKKTDVANPVTESLTSFWQVEDMFTFYNVGFSHTVGNTKYLTCADCEAGPIGYHNITTKISFVALSRVNHA